MSSLINTFNLLKNSDKVGLILCDREKRNIKTFREMYEIFEKLSEVLKNLHNKCIGLMMEKNVYIASIILSLHKLNCIFTSVSFKDLIEPTENLNLDYILSFENINRKNYRFLKNVILDKNYTLFIWQNINMQETFTSQSDIFCIMKSSGTTGKNKIIGIPYKCIESNALSLSKIFNVKSNDVIFWGTPLSFDPSLIEMLMGLLNGATIVIVTQDIYMNPEALFNILFNTNHVTILQMVPSVFQRWNNVVIKKIMSDTSLRILALGGEIFPKTILEFKRNESLRLFNLYGITELSCWATVHEITHETVQDDIPIGTCVGDTIIKVYDKDNMELHCGVGVAFLGSQTRKCYVNDEFKKTSDVPDFRETGDLMLIKKGNMYYKGRKDKLVKRFGHKINLISIEDTILTHCGLISKCVWCNKNNKILTFVLMKEFQSKDVKDRILEKIHNKLIHILPETDFPDYFEILYNFPMTVHGKIDEKELQHSYAKSLYSPEYDSVKIFTNLWCKYLGIDKKHLELFKNNSFFELGGNSIKALQIIDEFREFTMTEYIDKLSVALLHEKFFVCQDIVRQISKRIDSLKTKEDYPKEEFKNEQLNVEKNQIKVLWKYNLKACVDATPLIFNDGNNNLRIAIGSFCNIFVVLDENGKEIFKEVLNGSIESTPIVSTCKKFLYIGCFDGTLYCINFNENQRVWEFKTKDRIKSTPVFSNNDLSIVVGSYDKHIYCLCTKDGSQLWKSGVNGSVCSNLLKDDFGVYVATTLGNCYCISESNGDIKWRFNCKIPIFGTPCLASKYYQILVPSVLGIIFCLCKKTGTLIWQFETTSNVFSSLVCFQDTIIFGSHDKNIYIVKICQTTYCSVKKWLTTSKISSTPIVYECNNVNIIVSVTNDGKMYLIDLETLSLLQLCSLPGEVYSSPKTYQNKIFVGCRDNNLYCLLI